ncbi:MAG: DUF2599 domain-containing protein [Actinomycetota bacterium]|nr:DUF2599 domain-containing protein [Actinomycetota bacterium]
MRRQPRRQPRRRVAVVLGLVLVTGAGVVAVAGCSPTTLVRDVAELTPSASTTPSVDPSSSPSSTAGQSAGVRPPYVAQARWVNAARGRSLHIFPTAAGRDAQGVTAEDEAWSEVVRLASDAAQPGIRAQFDCHWTYARLLDPAKVSWNIEPWRPIVSDSRMVQTGCNPGGAESLEN